MRPTTLLTLTALLGAVAGCGSQGREQEVASVPERDLTLATQTPGLQIASAVEVQQLRTQYRTVRLSQRTTRRAPALRSSRPEPKVVLAAVAAPAPVTAAPEPVAQPVSTADNGRELLPGKTVTIIPASNGSSSGPDEADDLPAARGRPMVVGGGGGGKCGGRGRGRGPGTGRAPRPDFR